MRLLVPSTPRFYFPAPLGLSTLWRGALVAQGVHQHKLNATSTASFISLLLSKLQRAFPLLGSSKMQHILQKNSVFPGTKQQILFENKGI